MYTYTWPGRFVCDEGILDYIGGVMDINGFVKWENTPVLEYVLHCPVVRNTAIPAL